MWRRVLQQLRDPLILVLLVAAAGTIATGDLSDAAVILLVITVNTLVGVVQEVRAEAAVMALSAMSAPVARVVRGGKERSVPAAEVVPGDLVLVAEGDIVPADGENVIADATSSTTANRSVNCPARSRHSPFRPAGGSSLGPNRSRRAAASADASPRGEVSSAVKTSPVVRVCTAGSHVLLAAVGPWPPSPGVSTGGPIVGHLGGTRFTARPGAPP